MKQFPNLEDVYFADFHIHGPYSIGASKSIRVEQIVFNAKKVGLNIVGTGDILQPNWCKYLQNELTKNENSNFQYKREDICFMLTGEIEDKEGIHHLFLLPDFETARELRQLLLKKGNDSKTLKAGRPIVQLNGVEIVEIVHELNGLIGPAHIFTPFKSIFRENRYDAINDFYKNNNIKVDFIELGLSANSIMADKIKALWEYPFLSNSDCHSTSPGKLGRELNMLKLNSITFENIRLALKGYDGNAIVGNMGLDPRLGKYYRSFCYKCRRKVYYTRDETKFNETTLYFKTENEDDMIIAIKNKKLRCLACGGLIKFGVLDRVKLISTTKEENNKRPPYYNTVPLIEAIRVSLNLKQIYSKRTLGYYELLTNKLGSETRILLWEEIAKIKKINQRLAHIIELLRTNKLPIVEGGGGHFGYLDPKVFLSKVK